MGSYKKKLFIALLVILLIGFFVCGSANASVYNNPDWYNIDVNYLLCQEQEYYAKLFVYCIDNSPVDVKNFYDNIFANYSIYFTAESTNPDGILRIRCYPYEKGTSFNGYQCYERALTLYGVDTTDLNIPSLTFTVSTSSTSNFLGFTFANVDVARAYKDYYNTAQLYLPVTLVHYDNQAIKEYLGGKSVTQNDVNNILFAISELKDATEEQTDEMKKLNNFMSSEDVDQDAYDMPTNNPTQDPTTDGINNIFNLFYNRITSWDSSSINVYIPFANKSFTIPANASEQLLTHFSNMGLGSTLKSLISAVWFYVLARYIIKDVQKYADGLKTGEILTKSDTNIKTEML